MRVIYSEELMLKVWEEADDPSFKEWRNGVNGNHESDMLKIDNFAKKTNSDIKNIKAELIKGTLDDVKNSVDTGYATPHVVSEAIKWAIGKMRLKQFIKSVLVEENNQKEIQIPFDNFDSTIHTLEIRVGGVPFYHERYNIENGNIVLNSEEIGFSAGKRIDFIITYLEQVDSVDTSLTKEKTLDVVEAINYLTSLTKDLENRLKVLENK